jgi:hypothetical protein
MQIRSINVLYKTYKSKVVEARNYQLLDSLKQIMKPLLDQQPTYFIFTIEGFRLLKPVSAPFVEDLIKSQHANTVLSTISLMSG